MGATNCAVPGWRRSYTTATLARWKRCSAALCFWANWRGEATWMKQVSEPAGAWCRRGSDSLTSEGSADIRLPLGELGLTPVGHTA